MVYDGTELVEGTGQGVVLGTGGCDEAYVCGSAIIDITTANKMLNVQLQNASTNLGADVVRRAELSGLQILKLDNGWDYFRAKARDVALFQFLGEEIVWNVIYDNDPSFDFIPGDRRRIQLLTEDACLVCYTITFRSVNVPPRRVGGYSYLMLDSVPVKESYSGSFTYQADGADYGVMSGICIVRPEVAGQWLSLMTELGGSYGAEIITNKTTIQIAKLPSNADVVRAYYSLGTQSLDNTNLAIILDGEEEQGSSFEHGSGSVIYNKNSGSFLFTGGTAAYRASGSNRYNTIFKWRKNATDIQKYGGFGMLSYGDPVFTSGCSHGIILSQVPTFTTFELALTDESASSGTPPYLKANAVGVTGVYLASLFPKKGSSGFFLQGK